MPVGSESFDCFPSGLSYGMTFPLCEIANFSTVDSAIEDGLNFRLTHAIIIIKYSMNSLFLYARKKRSLIKHEISDQCSIAKANLFVYYISIVC